MGVKDLRFPEFVGLVTAAATSMEELFMSVSDMLAGVSTVYDELVSSTRSRGWG